MAPKNYNHVLHVSEAIKTKLFKERESNRISASFLFNEYELHPEEIESALILLKSQSAIRDYKVDDSLGIEYIITPQSSDPSAINYFISKILVTDFDDIKGELKILGKVIKFSSQKHKDLLHTIFSEKTIDAWTYAEIAEASNDSASGIDTRYKGITEAVDKILKTKGVSDFFLKIGRRDIKLNKTYLA